MPRSTAPRAPVPAPAAVLCSPIPLQQTLKYSSGSVFVGSGSWCTQVLFEPSKYLWQIWALILNMILPFLPSCWGFPLPFDMVYLILVGSNILLLMLVQQWVLILEFSQEKMSTPHP